MSLGKKLGTIAPQWITAGLGDVIKHHVADTAALTYMNVMQRQLIVSRDYETNANHLLEFLERKECSQRVNNLLKQSIRLMISNLQAQGKSWEAGTVQTRLSRAQAQLTGFDAPQLERP